MRQKYLLDKIGKTAAHPKDSRPEGTANSGNRARAPQGNGVAVDLTTQGEGNVTLCQLGASARRAFAAAAQKVHREIGNRSNRRKLVGNVPIRALHDLPSLHEVPRQIGCESGNCKARGGGVPSRFDGVLYIELPYPHDLAISRLNLNKDIPRERHDL